MPTKTRDSKIICASSNDINEDLDFLESKFLPKITQQSHLFVSGDESLTHLTLEATSRLYGIVKNSEPYKMSPLNELLVEGFDMEQIWEQLQLENKPMMKYLESTIFQITEQGDITKDSSSDSQADDYSMDGAEAASDSAEDVSDDQEAAASDSEGSTSYNDNVNVDECDSDQEFYSAIDEESIQNDEESDDEIPNKQHSMDCVTNEAEIEISENQQRTLEILPKHSKNHQRTVVDDDFFSVREMESFAQKAEEYDIRKGRGEFDDDDADDEEKAAKIDELRNEFDQEETLLDIADSQDESYDIKYEDFFGESATVVRNKNVSRDDEENVGNQDTQYHSDTGKQLLSLVDPEDSDDLHNMNTLDNMHSMDNLDKNALKSTFEKKQEKMSRMIDQLEQEAVSDKPWMLKGEIASNARPVNSLLEEHLEVDFTRKIAPQITQETTQTLEEIIKKRIKDDLFDDLEPKRPKQQKTYDPNRRVELVDEKSSIGLGQVYEEEYLKLQQGSEFKSTKTEALERQHHEITSLFKNLCNNLDALSNWHFTPKAPQEELEILPAPNVPAIAMEEAIPVAVSTNKSLLAPQEIHKGEIGKSAGEKDSADKKKDRAKRKRIAKRKYAETLPKKALENQSESQQKQAALKELSKQRNVQIVGEKNNSKKPHENKQFINNFKL